MDWEYIMQLSPENLTEKTMDELFSFLAWCDIENEDMNESKHVAVIKLCQEIMKYKAQQVGMLKCFVFMLVVETSENLYLLITAQHFIRRNLLLFIINFLHESNITLF